MRQLINKFWNDDCGALIAAEYLFIATILVIGIVVGLNALRAGINTELSELANAYLALSQSYTLSGVSGCCASVEGSQAVDTPSTVTQPVCVDPTPTSSPIDVIPCG